MPLKIMIVDNEPATAKLLRALAIPLNHTVLAFDGSRNALQRAQQMRLDIIFLGARLPELDEFELIRRIRDSQLNAETTIVMLAATDDVANMRRAFAEGASYVLIKPVDAARIQKLLAARESPDWKNMRFARLPLFTEVNCTRENQQFTLRSINISESGMLLQSWPGIQANEEVFLEFQIPEVRSSLRLHARIVRNEGAERVGVEFIGLTPEDRNAIHLYVLGRATKREPQREGPRNIWLGKGFFR